MEGARSLLVLDEIQFTRRMPIDTWLLPKKHGAAVNSPYRVLKHVFSGHSEIKCGKAPKVDLLYEKIHKEVICSIKAIATYL